MNLQQFFSKQGYDISEKGSWQIAETFKETKKENLKTGMVCWKPGHVAIYIGDDKVVEAKGINYGTIISNINKTAWQKYLYLEEVNYNDKDDTEDNYYDNVVWNYDEVGGWCFYISKIKGDYFAKGIFCIEG